MAQDLRFGLCTDQNLEWHENVRRWRLFEELGLDSAWNCDHLIQPSRPDGPYFEALTHLAGLAQATSRIRVGCLVFSNTFRHPVILAKAAVTVDHISNGRLELGFGAGWYEAEHDMYGIDFPPVGELVSRFEEAVQLIDMLLRNDTSTLQGKYYPVQDATMRPAPLQKPRPPLTIGAKGPRMLRIAARYADSWNSSGTPEDFRARSEILDDACAEIGRDPDSIVRSAYLWVARSAADPWDSIEAFRDIIGRYREAGASEFIIDHPRDGQLPVLERVAAEVIPAMKATGAGRR